MTQSLYHSSFLTPISLFPSVCRSRAVTKQPLCSWVSVFSSLCLGVAAWLLNRSKRCWPSCKCKDMCHPEAGAEGTQVCPPCRFVPPVPLPQAWLWLQGTRQGTWPGLKLFNRKIRYRAAFPALVCNCSSSHARARTRGDSPGTRHGLGTGVSASLPLLEATVPHSCSPLCAAYPGEGRGIFISMVVWLLGVCC